MLLEVPIPKELVENSDWGLQLTANFVWTVGENQSSSTSGERRKRFVCPRRPQDLTTAALDAASS